MKTLLSAIVFSTAAVSAFELPARERLIADYLDPCPELCDRSFYREEEQRAEQRRQHEEEMQQLREIERRQRWLEMKQFNR